MTHYLKAVKAIYYTNKQQFNSCHTFTIVTVTLSRSPLIMAETGNCRLLECAAEIRNTIYSHVLSFDHRLIRKRSETDPNALALLRVSKAVESEAGTIFYEVNQFHFRFKPPEGEGILPQVPAQAQEREHNAWISAMPERHADSLKSVSLIKELPRCWPNGPVLNSWRGEDGLGLLECEQMINWLAARNAILNVLSITLRRQAIVNYVEFDQNPLVLLSELDKDHQISAAVTKLSNLKRLEVWKSRSVYRRMWKPSVTTEWTRVQPTVFQQLRLKFPQAKSVLYSRRLEDEPSQERSWFLAEGYLIDFTGWGVELKETTDTKENFTLEFGESLFD